MSKFKVLTNGLSVYMSHTIEADMFEIFDGALVLYKQGREPLLRDSADVSVASFSPGSWVSVIKETGE